jgi:hypothetical protein
MWEVKAGRGFTFWRRCGLGRARVLAHEVVLEGGLGGRAGSKAALDGGLGKAHPLGGPGRRAMLKS